MRRALTEGFQLAFLGAAGFAVVAAVFAFVVTPRIRATADGQAVVGEPAVDAT